MLFAGLVLTIYVAISSKKSLPQKQHIHDWPRKDAWIEEVNRRSRIVTVTTVEDKIRFKFEVPKEDLQDFHKGSIAPVSVKCAKGFNNECDLTESYKLFVSGREVVPR